MWVNNRITPTGNHEATSCSRTPADGGRNRVRGEHQSTPNRSGDPVGGPSHGGHSGGGGVAARAAAAVAPPTTAAKELAVAATAEAEATRTATPPATLTAAMMPATGSTRFAAPRRLLKSVTATASPPTLHDFVICSFLRNSNLSGSPSTTRSKTHFSGSGVMPCPLKTLVATTTRSASTSPSVWIRPHSLGSSRSIRTRSTNGTS
jgi:hypothetical protein